MWKTLFGQKAGVTLWEGGLVPAHETPYERLGPHRPPGPSANRPGVSVHAMTAVAAIDRSVPGPGVSRLGRVEETSFDRGLSWAAVVLSGEARGDVVLAPGGPPDLPHGTMVLLEGLAAAEAGAGRRIPRDALTGTGLPGVTGARLVATTAAHSVLRLGPPPAARWAVVGLRSVAVFTGKVTLFDGDEGLDVWAGSVALVSDPGATLYIQAGNDTAVAIALAAPEVLVRLG